jgi:hypothetical protein
MATTARDRNRIELKPAGWIDPGEWDAAPESIRLRFLGHVGEVATRLKREELRKGIGADGAKLKPVRPSSRPDGAGGPPLDPHYGESRSVQNLKHSVGRKAETVTLWWTGRSRGISFGAILGYHARGEVRGAPVRDVLDLTEADHRKVREDGRRFWKLIARPAVRQAPAPPVPPVAPSRVVPPRARPGTIPTAARPLAENYPHLAGFLQTPQPVKPPPLQPQALPRPKNRVASMTPTATLAQPSVPTRPPTPAVAANVAPPAKVLPGRPIAERLAAYSEGDRHVAAIAAMENEVRPLRQRLREVGQKGLAVRAQVTDPANADRFGELKQQYQAIQREQATVTSELAAAIADQRRKVHEILGADSSRTWQHVGPGLADEKIAAAVKDADAFFAPLFVQGRGPAPIAQWRQLTDAGKRAYYDTKYKETWLSSGDDAGIAVHEWGHHLENHFPEIGSAAQEFLNHRVKDEEPASLRELFGDHFDASEMGRKDKFERAFGLRSSYYVGKDYGSRASEITSMGLEAFYRNPAKFAAEDPEFAKYLIGILKGTL